MKTLAIFSPRKSSFSETFIQAHKNLPFNIKYYYNGDIPTELENSKSLFDYNLLQKILIRTNRKFSLTEHSLINSLKREKVDCVLAEFGTTGADSLKVIKSLKLPLIVHFHGQDASINSLLERYKEKYKLLFDYASKIVIVSNKMYEKLIELGCPKDKLVLNCYGPNDSFFNCQPIFKKPQFIAVGRFVNKKAPYHTIYAFKKVVDKIPAAKLIMIGSGELLSDSLGLIKLLKLTENIDYKGICSPLQIKEFFEESIAFVQHSVTAEDGDSEGTPVVILEAQAAGLPVISTYHAGIPDVVIHNKTGLLVEEHDFEGMAENMIRILKEDGLAKKLGDAGRKRVRENFSMKKHLSLIENLVKEILNN